MGDLPLALRLGKCIRRGDCQDCDSGGYFFMRSNGSAVGNFRLNDCERYNTSVSKGAVASQLRSLRLGLPEGISGEDFKLLLHLVDPNLRNYGVS